MASRERVEAVAGAAIRLRAAKIAVEEAEADLDAALEAAREAHVPWAELAAAAGMTAGQLNWRWHRDDPGRAEQLAREREERARARELRGDAPRTRPGRGPGVSVTEAARRLGVTRRTVYLRIERGELVSTENELGQTRVLL